MASTIHDVIESIRTQCHSERDKGTRFELATKYFLINDPEWAERLEDIHMWSDSELCTGQDVGIDLVAKDKLDGSYWAIQCKCHKDGACLNLKDCSTFFTKAQTEPDRQYYKHYLIVTTAQTRSSHLKKHMEETRTVFVNKADMEQANIDWQPFLEGKHEDRAQRKTYDVRPHQQEAINAIISEFENVDRCKAIMACGIGKTLMALRLTEEFLKDTKNPRILFCAPSIALVSQSMREWMNQSRNGLRSLVVCSDAKASHRGTDDLVEDGICDIAFPATTNPEMLAHHYKKLAEDDGPIAVFTTYQSMQVISDAQKLGLPEFNLIICDEAHRTTGVADSGTSKEEAAAFTKVHDQAIIAGKKRLYMTATERIYGEKARRQGAEDSFVLTSMDDEDIYGHIAYEISFAEAVELELLADYKVVVLAITEDGMPVGLQKAMVNEDGELPLPDVAKIIGTWKGLAQHGESAAAFTDFTDDHYEELFLVDDLDSFSERAVPLHRAVGFTQTIADSKRVVSFFNQVTERYAQEAAADIGLDCELDHVDGSMDSKVRAQKLAWLSEDASVDGNDVCRILTNARCLSEGVDVPSLDAVIFFAPKRSEIDVVQAVGRVMRSFKGKKYGYIILPVFIPAGMTPEESLSSSKTFDVVWKILQALRSHDKRVDAYVNSLPFRKGIRKEEDFIGKGSRSGSDPYDDGGENSYTAVQPPLELDFGREDWERAIFSRMVDKCGTRVYWDTWAADIACIAERHIADITRIIGEKADAAHEFEVFLNGLRDSLNAGITQQEAIEMVAQHMITLPVFDALFKNFDFRTTNPVAIAVEQFLTSIKKYQTKSENDKRVLDDLYAHVRRRAMMMANDAGRQQLIKDLYENFFKEAFRRTSDKMGIVYTPNEIVDYILHTTDRLYFENFGKHLCDEGVHCLDPFTGTGTFVVNLLDNERLMPTDRLAYKYANEIHANEILLLAYYIACINIEHSYHRRMGGLYEEFPGAVLTDTFQMHEEQDPLDLDMFVENSERVLHQMETPINVIFGNPPYSAGQSSANDNNQNESYPTLDNRIAETYAAKSNATNKNSLYDSYIRAFRWASDRIGDAGIVAFVTNGGWLRSEAGAGMRRCLAEEFNNIYVYDLRGNCRTQGEQRRKERDNVFGQGTRTPVVITTLVKNPSSEEHGVIRYHNIGDYLTRDEKLDLVKQAKEDGGPEWEFITPDRHGDWLDQRDDSWYRLAPMGIEKMKMPLGMFQIWSRGIATARDAWNWGYSSVGVKEKISRTVNEYNAQLGMWKSEECPESYKDYIDRNPTKVSWSQALENDFKKGRVLVYDAEKVRKGIYRPFCKQSIYYDSRLNERVYQTRRLFPEPSSENMVITFTVGDKSGSIITDCLPDLHFNGDSQCFPLYYYDTADDNSLFSSEGSGKPIRRDTITDSALKVFRVVYPNAFPDRTIEKARDHGLTDKQARNERTEVAKVDIFYYIYGILHSPEYRKRFAANLAKELPRIPFVHDFAAFTAAGRALAKLHLNYENGSIYPLEESYSNGATPESPGRVTKMTWGKIHNEEGKRVDDRSVIVYNGGLTLSGIPDSAHAYVVNGRSGLEWMLWNYQVKTDKASGIVNDPNNYSENPRYIVDLIKRVTYVSVETMQIVGTLPQLNEVDPPNGVMPPEWTAHAQGEDSAQSSLF